MLNRPYILNHTTRQPTKTIVAVKRMGRAVLIDGRVYSAASGVGRVAHRNAVSLAEYVARQEARRMPATRVQRFEVVWERVSDGVVLQDDEKQAE